MELFWQMLKDCKKKWGWKNFKLLGSATWVPTFIGDVLFTQVNRICMRKFTPEMFHKLKSSIEKSEQIVAKNWWYESFAGVTWDDCGEKSWRAGYEGISNLFYQMYFLSILSQAFSPAFQTYFLSILYTCFSYLLYFLF